MVSCDQLYKLDMRLREVKQQPGKVFRGVAVFVFGDLLQLKPCQARFIFEEPRCTDYHLGFYSAPLWQSFQVINLVENHRQEGDRDYANLLNRIRIGQVTQDDLDILRTRIRPKGHADLDGSMYL